MTDQVKDASSNAYIHQPQDDPMSHTTHSPLDDVTTPAHNDQVTEAAATAATAAPADPIVIQLTTANDDDVEPIEPENDSKRVKVCSRSLPAPLSLCHGFFSPPSTNCIAEGRLCCNFVLV
jgi:hypothetical protein